MNGEETEADPYVLLAEKGKTALPEAQTKENILIRRLIFLWLMFC